MNSIKEKTENIINFFSNYSRVAVALSGGVDSAVLLSLAKSSKADVNAYFVKSAFQPEFELNDALKICGDTIPLTVIETDILSDNDIVSNPENRCYFCKKRIFTEIKEKAKIDGCDIVVDGTNSSDDISDRPGYKALSELGIISPLKAFGFTKQDIRQIAFESNIPVFDKPSYACLATRIPCGTEITKEILNKTENAEKELFSLGFKDFRIRYQNGDAKLQISEEDMSSVINNREDILKILKKYYNNVLLDLKARNNDG